MVEYNIDNKSWAVREAAKHYPELFHGTGDYDNMIKRITRQM